MHSPGPWRAAPNGLTRTITDREGRWVAHVMGNDDNGLDPDNLIRDANERLIIAAPRMFELLKLVFSTADMPTATHKKVQAMIDDIERPNDLKSVLARVDNNVMGTDSAITVNGNDFAVILGAARTLLDQQQAKVSKP